MPTILNLKFKGNKSFVPFSNLTDTDSLTKTWKICTKVASFLEQGQRLENLSWRLWHLQNLIVDTDNAKSKREFKKLSKHMGDKLDKEKGRSIEELEAPGFRRNHSTELIQQRAIEKERNREASINSRPGTITRMQFTFSVDQPTPAAMSGPVQKPDLKPSAEFTKRGRRNGGQNTVEAVSHEATNDKDPPLTQRGRKFDSSRYYDNNERSSSSLRFPSLFSNDFDPHAILYPKPTRANAVNYGEGVSMNTYNPADGFSIMRPTIELPLDELLNHVESPGPWSSTGSDHDDFDQDIEMKPAPSLYHPEKSLDTPTTPSFNNLAPLTPLTPAVEELPSLSMSTKSNSNKRPALSLKTQTSTRSSNAPSATLTSVGQPTSHNSAPGGAKAECSNCGATHTPLWRRGLNDELNCNACGLYCKLHKRPRPKNMRTTQGEGRAQVIPRPEPAEVVVSAQCYNCHTTATPLWRKDDEGKTVCNACGLYYKLHGAARPISMKSDVIRKRSRHDSGRRVGPGPEETPSASPGASRRASPIADPLSSQQPTLAPDSTTQISYGGEADYRPSSQSELMGALGQDHHFGSHSSFSSSLSFNAFPGPYHPDYLSQNYSPPPQESLGFSGDDSSDMDSSDYRVNKRRRMSTDSASEPPSSAVSYSSYAESYSTGQTSATSHSQRSSMDFPYNNYSSFGFLRGPSSTTWHPPMLPPTDSPHFIHPPMLPPDESPMDFLHPPMLPHDDDALFATYLHPPMILPNSPPVPMNALQLHPPMLPHDFKDYKHDHSFHYDQHHMQTY